MTMTASDRVTEGDYSILSERQQAFIDALALVELEVGDKPEDDENPEYRDLDYVLNDVLDAMDEEFDEKPYAGSNATVNALKQRRDLIQERKHVIANERNGFEGAEVTEDIDGEDGEIEDDDRVRTNRGKATYDGPAVGIDATMQHISERPVKSIEEEDDEILITISFTKDDLFKFLREADEDKAKEVFDEVMS